MVVIMTLRINDDINLNELGKAVEEAIQKDFETDVTVLKIAEA